VAEKNLAVANEIPNQLAIDFNKHSDHNTDEIDPHHGMSIAHYMFQRFFFVVNFCCILATPKHKREHSVTNSLFFYKRFVNSQEKEEFWEKISPHFH
jgi:hypothetical protein